MQNLLFPLGQLVITSYAIPAFEKTGEIPLTFIQRHATGDYGDLEPEDYYLNTKAIHHEERILSAYHLKDGTKIYIITEWDRSVTTVMLASDY